MGDFTCIAGRDQWLAAVLFVENTHQLARLATKTGVAVDRPKEVGSSAIPLRNRDEDKQYDQDTALFF